MMSSVMYRDGLGVPPPQMQAGSRFPLQLRALITGLAGFPLQSLTRIPIHAKLEVQANGES
jgi:hypothetical protein